jgi:hypothetical protein
VLVYVQPALMQRANSALGVGFAAWYGIAMTKLAAVLFAFAVMASGCGDTSTGSGGSGGVAGAGGNGGSPPPPPAVDQTCRDWCANEPEGFSCYQGSPETVQGCYEACLSDYQSEVVRRCGEEWIAIKDCELDLDCEDLFGDCEPIEDAFSVRRTETTARPTVQISISLCASKTRRLAASLLPRTNTASRAARPRIGRTASRNSYRLACAAMVGPEAPEAGLRR